MILCFFLFPLIPLIIAFHGDEERKFEEESDVVEKGDCQAPNDENDCSMVCDEERAIGSHHSLQDSEDGEHVELDEYVPHRKTFNRKYDIYNPSASSVGGSGGGGRGGGGGPDDFPRGAVLN